MNRFVKFAENYLYRLSYMSSGMMIGFAIHNAFDHRYNAAFVELMLSGSNLLFALLSDEDRKIAAINGQ